MLKDISGERFGKLTVIKRVENDKWGGSQWLCKCDCGNDKIAGKSKLTSGNTKSCGCYNMELLRARYNNLKGMRFGRLVAIDKMEPDKNGHIKWLCQCDCGNVVVVLGTNLEKRDHTRSCGCFKIDHAGEQRISHGMSSTRLYNIWSCMMARCYNTKSNDYQYYGERGIDVCEEWHLSDNFLSWALENGYKEDLQIDRIDNNKGYSPHNCRFVERYVNVSNRRKLKCNTSGYTGVYIDCGKYRAKITSKLIGGEVSLGYFDDKHEAVKVRNEFIIKHNLPHPIQAIHK